MITKEVKGNLIEVAIFGEFTLDDYKEFEEIANYRIKFEGEVNLLMDLRDMTGFTIDVAWEEIRYSRAHAMDFGTIAVITEDQYMTWSAWISQFFVDADVQVFPNEVEARTWLEGEEVV